MNPAISLRRPRQRGVTLIEALVALMVMSFGMVALVALMSNLRRSTDVGKQRSEAMRIAQAELAKRRAFYTLVKPNPTDTTVSDYETDIVSQTAWTVTVPDSNTTFSVKRDVTQLTSGFQTWGKTVQVEVSWTGRASRATDPLQTLVLDTIIARVDPAFAGAVSLAPAAGTTRQPQDRHSAVPPTATDLGNKTSAFRPSSLSAVVWVFNNVTGVITKTCSITPATALTASSVSAASCVDTRGFLMSGTINFSNTNPANPATPEATALPLGLTIRGGTYRAARADANGVPVRDASHNIVIDSFSVAAPATFQCFSDAPTSTPSIQPFINYNCIVIPGTSNWSGSLELTGLSFGTTASDYRVCRYSADYDGSGDSYANALLEPDNFEHPAVYVKVASSLSRQNFLVIKGDVDCPTAPAVNLSAGVFTNYSTVQLQP